VATVLHNVLSFTGLVLDTPAQIAHGLQLDHDSAGVVPLTPQLVAPERGPFTVAVDATNVTVTRTNDSPGDSVDVWVQWSHTIDQVWPRTGLPAALPHIIRPGLITGGNGTLLNVATVAALAAYAVGPLDDGAVAYVASMDDLYTLTKTGGPYVADNLAIVAASGGGYWIAQTEGRWDDVQGNPEQGNAASALTNEAYRDTALRLLHFRHDQNDSLHYVYQMQHKWRSATSVHPHIHLVPCADPAAPQNAYFTGYYTWAPVNFGPIPALATWTTFAVTLTVNPGDVFTHRILEFGMVAPPANPTASSCLLLYLQRAGTNPLDTYTTNKGYGTPAANLAVLSSDVHYRAQAFGTLTEYA